VRIKLRRIFCAVQITGVVGLAIIFISSVGLANASEVIVDNRDDNTVQLGRWRVSSGPNPFLGESIYSVNDESFFEWYPVLPQPGDYDVYAWWTYHKNRSSKVPFRVRHDEGTTKIIVDMKDQTLGGRWNILGRFSFSEGVLPEISVTGENGQASADAVRMVLRDVPGPAGISGWSKQQITCPTRAAGTAEGNWYWCERRCLPSGARVLGGGGDYAQVNSAPGVHPSGPIEWEMVSSAPVADDMWRTVWRSNTVTTVQFAATTYALCAAVAPSP